MKQRSLKTALADWTDIDIAQYQLGICLNMISSDVPFNSVKHIFWSDNQIGNALAKMLDTLAEAHVLEKRDEPDFQYRWNENFKNNSDGTDNE
jgi:hypothetical protein